MQSKVGIDTLAAIKYYITLRTSIITIFHSKKMLAMHEEGNKNEASKSGLSRLKL